MKTEYERFLDSLNYFGTVGTVSNFSISQEYGAPTHYEIDVTPYDLNPYGLKRPQTITWNASPDTRVRTNNEKMNKEFEEIKRKLTKSILDEYDLNYIDTDIAATNEALANHIREAVKNYISEGKKMKFKRGDYELACFSSAPITNKYNVKKIIHSGLWTIVTWEDGTLTKVKMEDDGHYDEYAAFTAALAKKVYGNNSKVHKILEKKTKRDLKDRIKNAKTVDLFPDIPEEKKKASREAAIKRRDGEL